MKIRVDITGFSWRMRLRLVICALFSDCLVFSKDGKPE